MEEKRKSERRGKKVKNVEKPFLTTLISSRDKGNSSTIEEKKRKAKNCRRGTKGIFALTFTDIIEFQRQTRETLGKSNKDF